MNDKQNELYAVDPYNMRGEDWRAVAVFLANAVIHLAPSDAGEFLALADSMEIEWSYGGHFADPWSLDRLVSGEDIEVGRQVRHVLPDAIYQALGVAYRLSIGDVLD